VALDPTDHPRQIVLTEDGPLLVSGPVDLVLPDGRRVTSERPVTALCACRRSRRYPYCDASHRVKARSGRGSERSAGSC
jgi:CDGSH-type Zn-finger protein